MYCGSFPPACGSNPDHEAGEDSGGSHPGVVNPLQRSSLPDAGAHPLLGAEPKPNVDTLGAICPLTVQHAALRLLRLRHHHRQGGRPGHCRVSPQRHPAVLPTSASTLSLTTTGSVCV